MQLPVWADPLIPWFIEHRTSGWRSHTTKGRRIRALERGVGRPHGAKEQGAAPLLAELVQGRCVGTWRLPARGPRPGAHYARLRRGLPLERARRLRRHGRQFTPDGVAMQVRRSKEDQLGKGRPTKIDFGKHEPSYPVLALKRWRGRLGRPSGPLFRVIHGGVIEQERIHPRAVSRAVQRAASWAALTGQYSARSLRRSHATSADAAGASVSEIQAQGGG